MKLYKIPIQTLVPVTNFQSRSAASNQSRSAGGGHIASSGNNLSYRYYPSWSTHTIVLFHGLVSSSIYLSALAYRLAERKIAQVILPDFRGHGDDQRNLSWNKSHDVVQDFEEMMIHFKSRTAVERISFMGHSFGARWMLKILKDLPFSFKIDHNFMIAPFLADSQVRGDWLVTEGESYKVNWPDGVRTGKEVFEYPKEFLDMFDLASRVSLPNGSHYLVEAGQDEILQPVPAQVRGFFKTQITLPDATHMGIVIEKNSIDRICDLAEKNII